MEMTKLTVLELCAGGGGQALGLEMAGFDLAAAVEIDAHACATLRDNRPTWRVIRGDIREMEGRTFHGVDLLAAGVPCPPFSIAGRQLGRDDERDLFPEVLRLVAEMQPVAVMLENVRGFANAKFDSYRQNLRDWLEHLGYESRWTVLNAKDFLVPQLRPRFVLVALPSRFIGSFEWPEPTGCAVTVGGTLGPLMGSKGWEGAATWAQKASRIAPTIVGGSKKHGGPDLGPTRAKAQWAQLGVDAHGLAALPPSAGFPEDGSPRLTVDMVALLQGFPGDWRFHGKKTPAYRQVGNAFPPPVACAVGTSLLKALNGGAEAAAQLRLFRERRAAYA